AISPERAKALGEGAPIDRAQGAFGLAHTICERHGQQRRPRREPSNSEKPISRPPSAVAFCSALLALCCRSDFPNARREVTASSAPDSQQWGFPPLPERRPIL